MPADVTQGLVGESSIGKVIIEGHSCDALMDGGSNVSIILELWGLSQTSYPYKGYIAAELQFPEDGIQCEPRMVLVLVCPQGDGPEKLPLIVGTNARTFSHAPRSTGVQGNSKLARTLRVYTAFNPVKVITPSQ